MDDQTLHQWLDGMGVPPMGSVLARLSALAVEMGYLRNLRTSSRPQRSRPQEQKENPIAARIYEIYPRKESRADGIRAIEKALKMFEEEYLASKTQAYADATALWPDSEKKYIPHCASWFNAQKFHDDPDVWVRDEGKKKHQPLGLEMEGF